MKITGASIRGRAVGHMDGEPAKRRAEGSYSSRGRPCGRCHNDEAQCARDDGCCPQCTHWQHWTVDGERING